MLKVNVYLYKCFKWYPIFLGTSMMGVGENILEP
jgi:hypothetical protein